MEVVAKTEKPRGYWSRPWIWAQTPRNRITSYTLEEAHETVDATDRSDQVARDRGMNWRDLIRKASW
jgi:NTP pyrophosphatase (non-canonical NTP hydrolase)